MDITISKEGLWAIIDSLSLKNKKWLIEKLQATITSHEVSKDREILDGIVRSVKEAKAGKTYTLDTLWDQL